jgi:hypothetical protein
VADGNVHVNVVPAAAADGRHEDAVFSFVASLGGSISAEHGIGALKARWLPLARSEGERALFGRIRSALDPAGTLNPNVLPRLSDCPSLVSAVEPPGRPADWMRVIDHQYGSIDFARWDDPGGPLEPADQTIIGNAGITCGTTDGYIHPAYPSQRSAGATQSGPAVNPYSSATSVPGGGAVCGRTSGT